MKRLKHFLPKLIFAALLITIFPALKKEKNMQSTLVGAWAYGPDTDRRIMIVTPTVFSVARFDEPGRRFIQSYGGTWRMDGSRLVTKIEWNSSDSTQVGTEGAAGIVFRENKMVNGGTKEVWERLDNGTPGALMGAWIISGTFEGDSAQRRKNPFHPRRTMKMLSGKYFHWIAYNVVTKTFMNAGGGSYTTTPDGVYTERIQFFTKTAESVGKTLPFRYTITGNDWRHQGQKSTGGVMDELWTRREQFEK